MAADTSASLVENELAHNGKKFPALDVPACSVPILLLQPEENPAVPKDLGT